MLKSKITSLLVLLMVMLVVMTGTSMAADDYTCKVSLLANTSEIKSGESVTLLVKVTDIQAGEGIASLNAELEYDEDVFDCEVSGGDEWDKTSFIEGALFLNRQDFIANSKDQTVAKIVLTAKSDVAEGNQIVRLKGMEFSTGSETFSVDDVSCTIVIKEDNKGNNDTPGNTSDGNTSGGNTAGEGNTGGSTSGGNSSGSGSGSGSSSGGSTSGSGNGASSSTPKTTSKGGSTSTIANVSSSNNSIPKTGITDILIVGAIIATIVSVIFYIKYKRAY